ncbi:MAG TPA: aldose epimerase family protein [Beijerinckiaceae bacterium]|nr:aldose epimerase family protein [Beijerinckiaceae bacterium]
MKRIALIAAALPAAASAQVAHDEAVVLRNRSGMEVHILPFGATVTRVIVPDRQGRRANVVLGYASAAEYRAKNRKNMFGATIGRYAGRIAGAGFTLDGKPVRLVPNDGSNALHGGGKVGFDNVEWRVSRAKPTRADEVTFSLTSPDGFQGFPGQVAVSVTYRLTADNALRIDYRARTTATTVLNLTNHSYFNLAGEGSGSVDKQWLQIAARRYVATDPTGVPTGASPAVDDTPLDFRSPHRIGERINSSQPPMTGRGYNHAWLLDKGAGRLAVAARLADPGSGRTLTILTTEPSVQVYTGGYIDGKDAGPSGRTIHPGDGVAIETQHLSDSPNRPAFPTTLLRPGQIYHSTTIWQFGTSASAR